MFCLNSTRLPRLLFGSHDTDTCSLKHVTWRSITIQLRNSVIETASTSKHVRINLKFGELLPNWCCHVEVLLVKLQYENLENLFCEFFFGRLPSSNLYYLRFWDRSSLLNCVVLMRGPSPACRLKRAEFFLKSYTLSWERWMLVRLSLWLCDKSELRCFPSDIDLYCTPYMHLYFYKYVFENCPFCWMIMPLYRVAMTDNALKVD